MSLPSQQFLHATLIVLVAFTISSVPKAIAQSFDEAKHVGTVNNVLEFAGRIVKRQAYFRFTVPQKGCFRIKNSSPTRISLNVHLLNSTGGLEKAFNAYWRNDGGIGSDGITIQLWNDDYILLVRPLDTHRVSGVFEMTIARTKC